MVIYDKFYNPLFQRTRDTPKDSDRNSLLLRSPSHRERSPSPNSPHQLSLTINGTTTNLNSQRQSRKRSKKVPVWRIRSYKRSKISIYQRSLVSPTTDTQGRSNLDIQKDPNNSSNNKIIIQNPYCTTEDKRELCSPHTDYSLSSRTEEPVTFVTRKAHAIENNFDNLMNELQASFNITRTVINNHRNFIESKLNQMTEQCEKLSINLNDS